MRNYFKGRKVYPSRVLYDVHGEYGIEDVVLSMPAIIGKDGIETKVPITVSESECTHLLKSAKTLHEVIKDINL